MKALFISLLIYCLGSLNSTVIKLFQHEQDPDNIVWSENQKLTWNDFQGNPQNQHSNKVAVTSSNIKIDYQYSNKGIISYTVSASFSKRNSWTKTKTNQDVLAHEQLHFDITELYARGLRKSFDSLMVKDRKNSDLFNKMYKQKMNDWKKTQNLYDSEVYGNTKMQQKWIDNIHYKLSILEKYKA